MNLTTNYLGLKLAHPIIPGASPLVDDLDTVKQLEDAGASAIVMHSLFEEQISGQRFASIYHMEMFPGGYEEAASHFPKKDEYRLGKDEYLEHLRKLKQTVSIPVIGSLNGTSPGGWTDYARLIEQAGADALELNIYVVASDPSEAAISLEQRIVDVVKSVKRQVKIPIAVKISPFFSSLSNFAHGLVDAGARGLVLFNRFYQPDIDIETRAFLSAHAMSDTTELSLRLRWLGILNRQIDCGFSCSGGVHTETDAIKAILAGAHTVQMVSALMLHGPQLLTKVVDGLKDYMKRHDIASINQIRGRADISQSPDMQGFERGRYVKTLQTWET